MRILVINPKKHYSQELISYLEKISSIGVSDISLPSPFLKKRFYTKKNIICNILFNTFYSLFLLTNKKYDFILLNGLLVVFPFLFLIKIFPFMEPKKNIIIIYFYIHKLGANKIIQKILKIFFNYKKVILLVQSPYEKKYYSHIINRGKVVYFPYCQSEISTFGNYGEGEEYIFSGGYTNRDYECLFNAAKKINHNFVVISSKLNRVYEEIPNIKLLRDVDADDFFCYLKNSKIVIIPLKEETGASGQKVALAAMFFKKPIIYADISSVSQFFDDGNTGIAYQKGNVESLIDKIIYLSSNPIVRKELGIKAFKKYYGSYHISKYHDFLRSLFL